MQWIPRSRGYHPYASAPALPAPTPLPMPDMQTQSEFGPVDSGFTYGKVPVYLYHYTDEEGYDNIMRTRIIFQSTGEQGNVPLHGVGVYFTSLPPGAKTADILMNNYGCISNPKSKKRQKAKYAFQFPTAQLPPVYQVRGDRRDIWLCSEDLTLDYYSFCVFLRSCEGEGNESDAPGFECGTYNQTDVKVKVLPTKTAASRSPVQQIRRNAGAKQNRIQARGNEYQNEWNRNDQGASEWEVHSSPFDRSEGDENGWFRNGNSANESFTDGQFNSSGCSNNFDSSYFSVGSQNGNSFDAGDNRQYYAGSRSNSGVQGCSAGANTWVPTFDNGLIPQFLEITNYVGNENQRANISRNGDSSISNNFGFGTFNGNGPASNSYDGRDSFKQPYYQNCSAWSEESFVSQGSNDLPGSPYYQGRPRYYDQNFSGQNSINFDTNGNAVRPVHNPWAFDSCSSQLGSESSCANSQSQGYVNNAQPCFSQGSGWSRNELSPGANESSFYRREWSCNEKRTRNKRKKNIVQIPRNKPRIK